MSWYSIFYWITVAENAQTFFGWAATLGTFFTLAFTVVKVFSDEDFLKAFKLRVGASWMVAVLFMTIGWAGIVFTPSKKDALLIIAGGAVGEFVTSDTTARQIPHELAQFVKANLQELTANSLKEAVEDAKPKKKDVHDMTKEELLRVVESQHQDN